MGQTLERLAENKISDKTIFNNRFVVEVAEKIHVHYRNLRILLGVKDFVELAKGMADSLKRWEKRGEPLPNDKCHLELCRKEVAQDPQLPGVIQVNHNKNLYQLHEGQIFAEGADLEDPTYIHLKIGDLRIELTTPDFLKLADAVAKAKENLCSQEQR